MKVFLFNPLYSAPAGGSYERYFIRSGSRWPHSGIKRKSTLPHYLPFPFFLAYAAAWLRRDGFEVYACDCVALDLPIEGLMARLEKSAPDIVFFETATVTAGRDLRLAADIKRILPGAKLLLGGPHTTVFPEKTLAENPAVDAVLSGEYEETLTELAAAFRDGSPLGSVKGLSFRGADGPRTNPRRPLIDPLDRLPEPAYDLFPSPEAPDPGVYWDGFCQHRPSIQMHASRGCPYRCDFCLWNQVMYSSGKYRTFSPERVVSEMTRLASRYGAREVYFDDDDFTINRAHVEAVCRALIASGSRVKWSCMGDAINLTEELVGLMADSGCVGIKFGVETGSPRLIRNLGKPVDLGKVKEVIRWCAARGIKTHATFSLGLTGEDEASATETLSFLEDLASDTIQVSLCTPFPGTRFFDTAEKEGLLKTRDWEKYDGKASEVVEGRLLDLNKAEAMRAKALKRWLRNRLVSPSWVFRQAGYFFRVLKGLGPAFIFTQLRAILDEERRLKD